MNNCPNQDSNTSLGEVATNRPYQFNGKECDIVTDLDYSITRYYNAKLGVWLSVDPLLDRYPGLSPYNKLSEQDSQD